MPSQSPDPPSEQPAERDGTVRTAVAADFGHFARFFRQLGVDDPLPERAVWEAEMAPHTVFVERDGAVVAYGHARALGAIGYVVHVVVDAPARGRGLGRLVMRALHERLAAAGCARWELNVFADNAPAVALYESLGLAVEFATRVVRLPWDAIAALPPPAPAARAVAARDAETVAALEREFDLPPGQLAHLRPAPGQVVVSVVDADRPDARRLGLARYDPAFPGACPFRAADAACARVLLEGLLPMRPADSPWIQLVVEDDAPLADALLAAGATKVHEIVHMAGTI